MLPCRVRVALKVINLANKADDQTHPFFVVAFHYELIHQEPGSVETTPLPQVPWIESESLLPNDLLKMSLKSSGSRITGSNGFGPPTHCIRLLIGLGGCTVWQLTSVFFSC